MKNNASAERQIPLPERKQIMLKIMRSLTSYFEQYQLKYCLIAGTLIGAVRHHGFIPWDDDFDIAMPYSDYRKLIELSASEPVSEDISISSTYNNPNHIWPMAKAISKKTLLVERNVLDRYQRQQEGFYGVYVDIFPIYGLPENEEERKKHCDYLNRMYGYAKHASRLVIFKKGYGSELMKVAYHVSFIPFRIIGLHFFLKRIENAIVKYPYDSNGYVAYGMGLVRNYKDVFSAEMFEDVIPADFEGLQLNIPRKYDALLKSQFGDYMIMPPESERVGNHGYAIYRE